MILLLILITIIILIILILYKNDKIFFNNINDNNKNFLTYPYIYFDIFLKNNKLYLICPIYNKNIYKYKNGSNVQILIFNNIITNNNTNTFNIIFNNKLKQIKLTNYITKLKDDIAITTLFKNDYKIFKLWYEYYKKQGIKHFYLYYNNKLTNDIINIFNYPDVTLIEWNYIYMNFGKNRHYDIKKNNNYNAYF